MEFEDEVFEKAQQAKELTQPLSPVDATRLVNEIAHGSFDFCWTDRVKRKMKDAGLIVGDLNHIFKYGKIASLGTETSSPGYFKYEIMWLTPNSIDRSVIVSVIPCHEKRQLKACDITVVEG